MIKIQNLKMFIDGDYLHITTTQHAASLKLYLAKDITMPILSDADVFGEFKKVLKRYGYVIYLRKKGWGKRPVKGYDCDLLE